MIATIFDTETTGLIDNHVIKIDRQPHVIEFYACRADLETGEVFDEMDRLFRPPSREALTEEISEITGITWQMVEDRSSFSESASDVARFLSSSEWLVAHNLSFDMEMIDLEFERLSTKVVWPRRRICTVEQTIWLKGYRLNLSGLHEHLFGERFEGAHRAKADVAALLRCCVELTRRGVL